MSTRQDSLLTRFASAITQRSLQPLAGVLFVIYFTIGRWLIYFITYVGSLILVELILLQDPHLSYFAHMVGILAAISGAIFSVVQVILGMFTYAVDNGAILKKGASLFEISISALIGHFFVGIADVILTPIWLVLEILRLVMDNLITDAGKNPDGTFICTEQNGKLYPEWKFKHMAGIGWILAQFEAVLDYKISVSDIDGGISEKFTGVDPGFKVRKLVPFAGDELYNLVKNTQERDIIPRALMNTIFGIIEGFISAITGEYAGTDVVKHFVFIDRLEFNDNNKVKSGQGSNPFAEFIDQKRSQVMGCSN